MENAKESGARDKPSDASAGAGAGAGGAADDNSSAISPSETGDAPSQLARPPSSRTPFTSLSQVDADLALARALQEQERAYMMLRNGGVGSDYGSSDDRSYEFDEEGEELVEVEEGVDLDHPIQELGEEGEEEEDGGSIEGSDYGEDAFDANDLEIDPTEFESDEAFARALQDAEEREVAARLMALTGLNDWVGDDNGDHGSNSQDAWQEVDPDEYSYEELIALGEIVGTENRGLSADTIASLTSVKYKAENAQDGNTDQCVICRLEYEDGESLVALSCKHMYHSECINKWLQINKVCPVCNSEVSTSSNNQS